MNIQTLTLGPLATNCYLVRQDGCSRVVIIDPAAIHIALADIQLEGRAGPGLVRIRRLDIIVIVKNQGLGICLWTSKSSQQKGSCIGFIQNDLCPSLLQDLLEIAGGFR